MKRLIALLISMLMCALALAACGNEAKPNDPQDSTVPSQETAATQSENGNTDTSSVAPSTPDSESAAESTPDLESAPELIPDLPTIVERANESYVRSVEGGREFTYEELLNMSQEDMQNILFKPAFDFYNYFDGLPDLLETGNSRIFWDTEIGWKIDNIYEVTDERYPDYESFVAEARKYFSENVAAHVFGRGYYFEYEDKLYIIEGLRGADPWYYSTEYEIKSASEDKIVYTATVRIFKDNTDKRLDESELTDEHFEFEYREYVLIREENGKWVLDSEKGFIRLPY